MSGPLVKLRGQAVQAQRSAARCKDQSATNRSSTKINFQTYPVQRVHIRAVELFDVSATPRAEDDSHVYHCGNGEACFDLQVLTYINGSVLHSNFWRTH